MTTDTTAAPTGAGDEDATLEWAKFVVERFPEFSPTATRAARTLLAMSAEITKLREAAEVFLRDYSMAHPECPLEMQPAIYQMQRALASTAKAAQGDGE